MTGAAVAMAVLALGGAAACAARQPRSRRPRARTAAPIDLTGTWVSIVTQDWRWRMVPPPKGDYRGIPMTPEALQGGRRPGTRRATRPPAKSAVSYGAPALMSVPGRVRINWQDDETLKVETDAGMQTRLLRFGPRPDAPHGRGAGRAIRWRSGRCRAGTSR